MSDENSYLRYIEAALFASPNPLTIQELQAIIPAQVPVLPIIEQLQEFYKNRGVHIVRHLDGYLMTTAPDVAPMLFKFKQEQKKLSRAALETLAIIAYHQPVTRAEIESVRGVALSKGTIDILLETGWVKPKGRKKIPGRPLTFGTTEAFLVHFGLTDLADLPGITELQQMGLLERGHNNDQITMDLLDNPDNDSQNQLNQAFDFNLQFDEE